MSTSFTASITSTSLPEPSTTTSPSIVNWLLKMAGYGGAPPTYTASSTAYPHLAMAEAAAAMVAGIVEQVSGDEQYSEARLITTADAFGGDSVRQSRPPDGGWGLGYRGNRGFRGVGNVFNYLTSSWALLCIFMAILLNRTLLYASLRRPTRLSWILRFLLRIIPILLFVSHIRSTLYALRCQTSPHLSLEEYPLAATIPYNFDEDRGGFLYALSRILTPWYASSDYDVQVCQAFGMLPLPGAKDWEPTGSLTILWPLYRTISIALFLSTFSHALQGPTSAGTAIPNTSSDTGLTLFEDSLAFFEAETLADSRSGNVSPEVLYIALISALAHLTSNIIGVIVAEQPGGIRVARGVATVGRYRLITTGIWGVAFLGGFTWALFKGGAKVLGFPTVCVVGFIPHLMVVVGITLCGSIYLLAAIFSTLAPPDRPREGLDDGNDGGMFTPPTPPQFDGAQDSGSRRRILDFSNLQANITLSTLTINWNEDFYTTLLKLGFQCLTAASEATYLNEGAPLRVPGLTWLERERIRVLERQRKWAAEKAALGNSSRGDIEVAMLRAGAEEGKKGYANDRKEIKSWMVGLSGGYGVLVDEGGDDNDDMANGRAGRRKLGSARGKKWMGAIEFLRGVVGVVGGWGVRGLQGVIRKMGFGIRGGIVGDVPQPLGATPEEDKWEEDEKAEDEEGEFDEAAMQILSERWVDRERDEEDRRRLYAAFLQARSLLPVEDDDESEEYTPCRRRRRRSYSVESDSGSTVISSTTTSLSRNSPSISLSSYSYASGSSGRSGSVTPTPQTPCPPPRHRHRHNQQTTLSLDGLSDMEDGGAEGQEGEDEDDEEDGESDTASTQLNHLAVLLDPQTPEQRSMAKIMARHLSAPRGAYVTRRTAAGTASRIQKSEEEEEARTLESIILDRRKREGGVGGGGDGEEGEGNWGPCVVCQSAPRTVVVWPCRCLALCEECRVSLAMRNFGTCVCCRREVGGVSRVFAV